MRPCGEWERSRKKKLPGIMKKQSWKWGFLWSQLPSCPVDTIWISDKTFSQALPEFLTPRSLSKIKPMFHVTNFRVGLLSSNDYQNNVLAWVFHLALLSLNTVFSQVTMTSKFTVITNQRYHYLSYQRMENTLLEGCIYMYFCSYRLSAFRILYLNPYSLI